MGMSYDEKAICIKLFNETICLSIKGTLGDHVKRLIKIQYEMINAVKTLEPLIWIITMKTPY